MAFEKFVLSGKRVKPRISIRKTGQIGFNDASRKKFKLDDYKYVILYYDKDEKKIGIELSNNENEIGIIKLRKNKLNVAISAKSFLNYYNIDYTKKTLYDPEWNEQEKRFIITLKNPETEQ